MDRLVSIDHLSGRAVLKLAPEDEEEDTKIERVRETQGMSALGTSWRLRLGGVQEVTRACSGQGSGSKGGLIDLPTCHHSEVKFRWILEMVENLRKIEWNAYKISSQAHRRACRRIFTLISSKNPSKNESKKSVQKIRPKDPSKKSVKISVSFYNCDCPDWVVSVPDQC